MGEGRRRYREIHGEGRRLSFSNRATNPHRPRRTAASWPLGNPLVQRVQQARVAKSNSLLPTALS